MEVERPAQPRVPDKVLSPCQPRAATITAPQPDLTTPGNHVKSKSRNGCRGCKARRLKCDEGKPECLQCLRRGRPCPGYRRDFKFSDKHEKLRNGGKPRKSSKAKATAETKDDVVKAAPQSKKSDSIAEAVPKPPADVAKPQNAEAQSVVSTETLPSESNESNEPPVDLVDLLRIDSVMPNEASVDGPRATPKDADPLQYNLDDLVQDAAADVEMDLHPMIDIEPSLQDLLDDALDYDPMPESPVEELPRSSNQLIRASKSKIPGAPIDLPTTLIEYWFTHVCQMWSAYDSDSNPNRQLALSNFSISEPVYYALQSMSAACLVDSLPHVKPVLASASTNALTAISKQVDIYYDDNALLDDALPTDLLLAIFAMATSLCWTDTTQLGEPLVIGARQILARYEAKGTLCDRDRKNMSHFRHALKYTEMLLNFVSSESAYDELETMRGRHRKRLQRIMRWDSRADGIKDDPEPETTMGPNQCSDSSCLHPWTGVSRKVQEQFGLVMALCRDNHTRTRYNSSHSASSLCESLCDIEVARELAADLMERCFTPDGEEDLQTGDQATPLNHLLDTAEAYRLAALQQLYTTFPDLPIRLKSDSDLAALPRDQALISLGLLLTNVLARIPADSGTRCIQPVLYVSAATGLRFDVPVSETSLSLTQTTIEVSRARKFIIGRLSTLLRSLPPRPIAVALRLIKEIWTEYDYGAQGAESWMDVMMNTGLQTLFG